MSLGITALLAANLTACSSGDGGDANAVCVDAQTKERVDDGRCDNDPSNGSILSSPFLWYFLGRSSAIPAFGVPIGGVYAGSFSAPRASRFRTGLPQAGASSSYRGGTVRKSTVSRGGFGGTGGKSGS